MIGLDEMITNKSATPKEKNLKGRNKSSGKSDQITNEFDEMNGIDDAVLKKNLLNNTFKNPEVNHGKDLVKKTKFSKPSGTTNDNHNANMRRITDLGFNTKLNPSSSTDGVLVGTQEKNFSQKSGLTSKGKNSAKKSNCKEIQLNEEETLNFTIPTISGKASKYSFSKDPKDEKNSNKNHTGKYDMKQLNSITALGPDHVPNDKYKTERKLYKNLDENGWLKMSIKTEYANKTKKKPKGLDNCAIIGDLDIFLESIGCSKKEAPETRLTKSNGNSKLQSASKKDNMYNQNQFSNNLKNGSEDVEVNFLGNLTGEPSQALPISNSFMNRIKQPACNYALRMKASDSTFLSKTVENKDFGYKRNVNRAMKSPNAKSPMRLKKYSELKANKELDDDTMKELDALIEADAVQNKFVDKQKIIGKIDFDNIPNMNNHVNNTRKSPNKAFLQDICLENSKKPTDKIDLDDIVGIKKNLKMEGIENCMKTDEINESMNVLDITCKDTIGNDSSNLQDSVLQTSMINTRKSKKNTFVESKSL